jgi:hypothetical protein
MVRHRSYQFISAALALSIACADDAPPPAPTPPVPSATTQSPAPDIEQLFFDCLVARRHGLADDPAGAEFLSSLRTAVEADRPAAVKAVGYWVGRVPAVGGQLSMYRMEEEK